MVEIARAFSVTDTPVSLVILDEPTSSLDVHVAGQLLAFVRRFVAGGGACILISHLLGEVLSTASRIVVMRDGKIVAARPAGEFTRTSLVAAMGSVARTEANLAEELSKRSGGEPRARARPKAQKDDRELTAYRGEVVGLAGLAGHGQTEMLRRLFLAARRRSRDAAVRESVALVAGDRQTDGIFPLWSIGKNITIGSMRRMLRGILIDPSREAAMAEAWRERIGIRTPDVDNNILSLSGGNQQKALFARALGSDAGIVLMDDPMRGVDIGTKQEVYVDDPRGGGRRPHLRLVHDRDGRAPQLRPRLCLPQRPHRRRPRPPGADRGEGAALLLCGRRMIKAAFSPQVLRALLPAFSLLILLAAIYLPESAGDQLARLQPDAQSGDPDRARDDRADVRHHRQRPRSFDRRLCRLRRLRRRDMAAGLAAARQWRRWPAASLVYMAVGALIHLRNLPSIVVTLGMSFVWLGLSVLVLPTPGRQVARLAGRADED